MNDVVFDLQGESLILCGEKAIFWNKKATLILADLHLGKVNHFRKSGIPAPQRVNDNNAERIIDLLNSVSPKRVILLGDLFHSHYNHEWEVFGQIINHFANVTFELVVGNHDVMSDYQYEKYGIRIYKHTLEEGPFLLSHEPLTSFSGPLYNLAGHIHPGVVLRGKGRQGLRLPCFYFGKQQGLLPAFGAFTGTYKVQPQKDDQVFVIADGKVLKV